MHSVQMKGNASVLPVRFSFSGEFLSFSAQAMVGCAAVVEIIRCTRDTATKIVCVRHCSPNSNPTPNLSNANPNKNPSTNTNPPWATCPRDALKLGVCANLLRGLISVEVGLPPLKPCCSLFQGLIDLEAALCLCTVIKANVLGINLDVPLSLSLLLNACGNKVPSGFKCA
ncbi:unnamed protein product [Lactuca saligna]|uniref:Bifunctional inhibitor/plant lipid transfer protein/seed storage helical domain-containing protein n=1 Tax=Lactuca saligna TaxID=75948 RepID=A0AA35ZDB1_LACSI|nr:unnamed protein product [Lactuca saligna]